MHGSACGLTHSTPLKRPLTSYHCSFRSYLPNLASFINPPQTTMKLAVSTLFVGSAAAFSPSLTRRAGTSLAIGREGNVELGGNTWKPDRWVMDANDRYGSDMHLIHSN